MIPSIAIVQVEGPCWRMPRLWIPLFLLWIPWLLLAPLVLAAGFIACLAVGIRFGRAMAVFWAILSALSGTHVHVSAQGRQVLVRIL